MTFVKPSWQGTTGGDGDRLRQLEGEKIEWEATRTELLNRVKLATRRAE